MRKIVLVLSYLGRPFKGFQSQPREDTVQKFLEQGLTKICAHQVRITAAGRTDAGVHACEQVVHFETKSKIAENSLVRALNSVLPEGIQVIRAKEVEPAFHARYSAKKREYVYCFSYQAPVPLYLKDFIWDIYPVRLDLGKMQKALKLLKGKHDFSFLSAANKQQENKVREVYKVSLDYSRPSLWLNHKTKARTRIWSLRIEASGFLQKMVRMVAGFLIEIGKGKRTAAQLKEVLSGKPMKQGKLVAPAQGLYLNKITYARKI